MEEQTCLTSSSDSVSLLLSDFPAADRQQDELATKNSGGFWNFWPFTCLYWSLLKFVDVLCNSLNLYDLHGSLKKLTTVGQVLIFQDLSLVYTTRYY